MATETGNYRDYQGPASRFPGSAPSTHVRDARLTLLETLIPEIFTAKRCLDIGCNAGRVSCQLAFDFRAASVTGVDIDPQLITQAESLLALRSSRVRPAAHDSQHVVDYFPISAVLKHGYRFEPQGKVSHSPEPSSIPRQWPCVSFVSEDWVVSTNPATTESYHVILALSVIKWIHLEHLDEGLVRFFRKCASSLASGGYFIVELQPWESYEKAIRPNTAPHFQANFQKLKYRPETSFTELLQEQGLDICTTSEALPRRIIVYRKR
ncbi:S-adenosyl-L-methionine-dependent methyltransferase [Lophiostoma macrostomum CBS 122681]|uniref:RNA methyltransferase n=1 Tax=Lophiostoma macrostomum CBS 122681 TaxID=1314788 RepID=A0A6A6TC99_9PLEO|nr:S-adenosyl-L-methionine-dependent methyltransferase [Lophiostoma macrostomum CBS 122681]